MKIYISGPISGFPKGNREAFEHAAELIRANGHDPVNPHEVCAHLGDTATWEVYMRADIKALMDCDAILQLKGWRDSSGAIVEHQTALFVGIKSYAL